MEPIRVLLADDQVLFVESLKRVIGSRAKDIRVVGIAYDGLEAVELVEKERPDVVLLDIKMPRMDGVRATREILARHPETRIMILTTFDDDEFVLEALRQGAKGYLLKNIPPEEVITSIRALNSGVDQISPSIAVKLVHKALTSREAERPEDGAPRQAPEWYRALRPIERQLLVLVAQGYSNKEIADRMYLAEQTVKNYLSAIYEKIEVKNRAQAVQKLLSVDKGTS
jgi:DNA-binding NarL/FixJ family response regulator